MKTILIFLLLFTSYSQAEEKKEKLVLPEVISNEEEDKNKTNEDEKIKLVLDDKIFDSCKQIKEIKEKDTCLNKIITEMPAAQQKDLLEKNKIKYQGETNFNLRLSPAGNKLKDYLYKRLQEFMEGDKGDKQDKNQPKKVVDPKYYFQLYHLQIQNTIVMTLSEYCIEADNSGIVPGDQPNKDKNRISNLNNLAQPGNLKPESNLAYQVFYACMEKLKNVCHTQDQKKEVKATEVNQDSTVTGVTIAEGIEGGIGREQILSACVISNKIRELRDKIAANAATQKKFLKEFANDPSQDQVSDKFDPNLIYDGTKEGEKDVLELTSMTSKEFSDKSESGKILKQDAEKFNTECVKGDNKKECEQMVYDENQVGDQANILAEYKLRTQLMAEKIRNYTEEELKKHLEQEGRTEAEIEKLIQSKDIKTKIAQQYELERKSYVEALKNELQSKTLRKAESLKDNKGDASAGVTNLHKSLADKPKRIKEVIYFSNIINGYFPWVAEGSGKVQYETGTLFSELKDSSVDKDSVKAVGDLMRQQGRQEQAKTREEKKGMGVDFINNIILKEYIEPTPKKTK